MTLPLSFAQRRLWLLDQLTDNKSVYTMVMSYDLTGPVDVPVLRQALAYVMARHDVLRSHVVVVDGEPCAVVDPVDRFELCVVDTSEGADPWPRASAAASALAERGFDLTTGPLLRATLFTASGDRHILQIGVHHVVFDGASRHLLEEELSVAYRAFLAGGSPELPPASPYAEFAVRQRAELARYGDTGLDYWRRRLAGAPPVLDLPTDRPHPRSPTMAGDEVTFGLPAAVADGLRAIARDQRTTLFVVTLAAYQYLLGFYSGGSDVVTGVPFSGRVDLDAEDVVGFFVNTGAIRMELRDDPSFRDLVGRTRSDFLDAMDHQEIPFDWVIEAMAPQRESLRNPLFQNWFDLTDEPPGGRTRLALPDVRCRLREHHETSTHFDLELHLFHRDGVLTGKLIYAEELFDRSTMDRLVAVYRELLTSVATDPDGRLSSARLMPAAQWNRELAAGVPVDIGPEPAPAGTVAEWFDRQATATPLAVAVSDAHGCLTYQELRARAERLARVLRDHGAGPERVVAVCLPRGRAAVVAMLGVVMAGAAYLPLDAAIPDQRLSALLADARATLVCTDREVPPGGPTRIDERAAPRGGPIEPAETVPTLPDDALYVVYTSGSTGAPKGVVVTHRTAGNLIRWHLARYGTEAGDRVSQTASLAFDAAAWEIWPALLSGARLDIVPDDVLRDPPRLVRHFTENGTTAAFVPTPLAEHLIREPLGERTRLRHLLTGGDVFRPRPTDAPGVPVANHYGPTEATVVATATEPLGPPWTDNSIGLPISGTTCHVVDRCLRLVPRGVVGELFLGGSGVARGYLGRSRLTASRFLPDPFGTEPGARLYRTGDLVRRRPDGTLAFVGRVDRQVKVSGHRIEPAEIEAELLRHPAVAQVAVELTDRGVLAAYVVPGGAPPDDALLRAHLRTVLPAHLVPSSFVTLAALPLTSNGKLDRKRLPPTDGTTSVAPRDDLERAIAAFVAEVLEKPDVGVEDDFFALGGHSISAMRLANRIGAMFDLDVNLREIFDNRTVARIAVWVRDRIVADIAAMSSAEIADALTVARFSRPAGETDPVGSHNANRRG
jgi:amino acid adenylation domain-containing protein